MTRKLVRLQSAIVLFAMSGCRAALTPVDPIAPSARTPPPPGAAEVRAEFGRSLLEESLQLQAELSALHQSGGWRERGYFTASENDALEGLFFRFTVLHSAFYEGFEGQGGPELLLTEDADRPRAHVLALRAGLSLADASSFLVLEFADDPVAISKLDEAFPRSDIPRGSWGRLRLAVSSTRRQDAIAAAWKLHEEDLAREDSELARLYRSDPTYAGLIRELVPLYARVSERLERLRGGPLDAARHSRVADLARETSRGLGDAAYAARKLVFTDVSRLRNPGTDLIHFSDEQKARLRTLLRPGDLLLTFTAGYMSNVFIPGVFKHGITYVGGAEERDSIGLGVADVPAWARADPERLAAAIARVELDDGARADLIEAVGEGVKFSNLDEILDRHVNRLLVLRPRLSEAERTRFVAGVFTFVGDPYDFRFDFADASMQVCTEVIWRALDGKGGIAFELTKRAGSPTLSADDIVSYHLASAGERFDFVLFAEEDPSADDHRARIWTDAEGEARVAERMSGS